MWHAWSFGAGGRDERQTRDVPGLRDRLIGNINRALGNLPDAVNDQPVLDAVSNLEWTVRALDSGKVQLIWVSAETLRVAARVAETIPPDTLFTEVERPPWGFAVFETPVEGVDAETGGTVVVDAMSWGPVRLRAVPGTDHLGIGCHTFGGHFSGEGSAHLAEEMPDDLVPIGRSDWLADDPIDVVSQMDDPTAAASMVEDRRLLVALWTLMDSGAAHDPGGMGPSQQEGTAPVRRYPAHCYRRSHSG